MESKVEYQVLSPNSVAWFIQAALVADRSGNEHTRDLALAEAQRIAAERRLAAAPAMANRATGQRDGELVLLEDDTILAVDILEAYDMMARRERAQAIGGG